MSTLKRSDFFYELPEELIAQTPVEPRDSSRLMVYSRSDGTVTHAHFRDLPNFLKKGDLLVINNTRVIPARLFGHIDGKETARTSSPVSEVEQFILISTEVQGYRRNAATAECTDEVMSDRFLVDYVRVFDNED